jgi:hypothetical protein
MRVRVRIRHRIRETVAIAVPFVLSRPRGRAFTAALGYG